MKAGPVKNHRHLNLWYRMAWNVHMSQAYLAVIRMQWPLGEAVKAHDAGLRA